MCPNDLENGIGIGFGLGVFVSVIVFYGIFTVIWYMRDKKRFR